MNPKENVIMRLFVLYLLSFPFDICEDSEYSLHEKEEVDSHEAAQTFVDPGQAVT